MYSYTLGTIIRKCNATLILLTAYYMSNQLLHKQKFAGQGEWKETFYIGNLSIFGKSFATVNNSNNNITNIKK